MCMTAVVRGRPPLALREVVSCSLIEPQGIAITGDGIYVAEYGGNRIHKLTTGGEFLGTFGESGSYIGQCDCPFDIKISPNGKVYVADKDNDHVQLFHSDWTYTLMLLMVMYQVIVDSLIPRDLPLTYQVMFM